MKTDFRLPLGKIPEKPMVHRLTPIPAALALTLLAAIAAVTAAGYPARVE